MDKIRRFFGHKPEAQQDQPSNEVREQAQSSNLSSPRRSNLDSEPALPQHQEKVKSLLENLASTVSQRREETNNTVSVNAILEHYHPTEEDIEAIAETVGDKVPGLISSIRDIFLIQPG